MIHYSREEEFESAVTLANGNTTAVFGNTLNCYAPDGFITKQALCRLFECSGRTIQRMIVRRDLPPPTNMAGKAVWHAGAFGAWLADAAKRKQAQVESEAARIRAILVDRWNN